MLSTWVRETHRARWKHSFQVPCCWNQKADFYLALTAFTHPQVGWRKQCWEGWLTDPARSAGHMPAARKFRFFKIPQSAVQSWNCLHRKHRLVFFFFLFFVFCCCFVLFLVFKHRAPSTNCHRVWAGAQSTWCAFQCRCFIIESFISSHRSGF